jgi:hypothetical protein
VNETLLLEEFHERGVGGHIDVVGGEVAEHGGSATDLDAHERLHDLLPRHSSTRNCNALNNAASVSLSHSHTHTQGPDVHHLCPNI